MDFLLSLCIGLGLSAACGFRVFVPLLVMSIASRAGYLDLSAGFAWIGTDTALIAFGVATALEIAGYYVPWMDNFLDSIATPAAIVAGTVVTASMVTEFHPMLRWSLALIAGGGVAGVVQTSTVLARGASSVGTGGLANPLLATVELGGSLVGSVIAIVAPPLAILVVIVMLVFAGKKIVPRFAGRKAVSHPPIIPNHTP